MKTKELFNFRFFVDGEDVKFEVGKPTENGTEGTFILTGHYGRGVVHHEIKKAPSGDPLYRFTSNDLPEEVKDREGEISKAIEDYDY